MTYALGSLREFYTEVPFKNAAGVAADPTTVRFYYTKPGAAQVIVVYPPAGVMVRDGVGLYHVTLDLDTVGMWRGRWDSEGDPQTATHDFVFFVSRTAFTVPA